ncbi:MAG: response regulator [Burkholderiaceae bacterium]
MARKIFIIEDDAAIRDNPADALGRHGSEIQAFADRPSAQLAAGTRMPDLAIIDVGLGDEPEGGFELCRWLRERAGGLPILILSARDSDIDVVSGLRLGADDYVTKSVSLPHLLARVTALFRRAELQAGQPAEEQVLVRGALRMDVPRFDARWNGQPLELTVTEFWMLHALARHPGHVKDREALMREANLVIDDHTVTSYVKRIRRKLQAIDPAFDAIETVYGVGYRYLRAGPAWRMKERLSGVRVRLGSALGIADRNAAPAVAALGRPALPGADGRGDPRRAARQPGRHRAQLCRGVAREA